ncbi:MAG: GTP cyclohydrolase I FolE [SAR324 cluster bacterium]|nr:GTP cyclohydrolase I FolE [SAR324 cluster bacterium]
MSKRPSKEAALEAVRTLMAYAGDDPTREGLIETPERVVKSYQEIFKGYDQDPKEILEKRFTTNSHEMVVLKEIELYSTCEHHMIPFVGICHIAYLPKDQVVGISKLARLMEIYSRRLQIQEELTHQIATALCEVVQPRGVAVMIEAKHMCMSCRGVGKQHSSMVTTCMLGEFKTDPNKKNDFFHLIGK